AMKQVWLTPAASRLRWERAPFSPLDRASPDATPAPNATTARATVTASARIRMRAGMVLLLIRGAGHRGRALRGEFGLLSAENSTRHLDLLRKVGQVNCPQAM